MSEILKEIREDLKSAMSLEIKFRKKHYDMGNGITYDKVIARKTVARAIISMFPGIGKKPADATDDDTIKLLKKYISQEKERSLYELSYLKEKDIEGKTAPEVKKLVSNKIQELGDELTSYLIEIAQEYLPKQATKEEIAAWIHENIDFSIYKNKMQAMGPITKHFKGCDGNFVKNLLIELS